MLLLTEHFHFIRPFWLLLLPLAIGFSYLFYRKSQSETGFESVIHPALMAHLSQGKKSRRLATVALLLIIWLSAIIALAGPSWQSEKVPVYANQQARVILLDLSPSMFIKDIKPSRLTRAKLKIRDLLNSADESLVALIVYGGEAFVVTPLTTDTATIENLLEPLSPNLLPSQGSNVEEAITKAFEVLTASDIAKGQLILLTDSIDPSAEATLIEQFDSSQHQLVIIGVGTQKGGVIPPEVGLLKQHGESIALGLDGKYLSDLANTLNQTYLPMTGNNYDIRQIAKMNSSPITEQLGSSNKETSLDNGYYFIWLALPFMLLLFRRGWAICLCVTIPLSLMSEPAQARSWKELWQSEKQSIQETINNQQWSELEAKAHRNENKGGALYKQEKYQEAEAAFAESDSALAHYNRGNALAMQQRFKEAVTAYNLAIDKDANLSQAKDNKVAVEKILAEQQKAKEEQEKQDEKEEQQKNDQQQEASPEQQSGESGENNEDQAQQSAGESNTNEPSEGSKEPSADTQEPSEDNKPSSSNEESSADNPGQQEPSADKQDIESDPQEKQAAIEPTDAQQTEADKEKEAKAQEADKQAELDQQKIKQIIRRVKDDPGGLLRRKFEYERIKRRNDFQQNRWQTNDSKSTSRY